MDKKYKILENAIDYHFENGKDINCGCNNILYHIYPSFCSNCNYSSNTDCNLIKGDSRYKKYWITKIIEDKNEELFLQNINNRYNTNFKINKENIMITKIKEQFGKVKKMPMLKQALVTAGTIFAVIAIIDNYSNIKTGIKEAVDKALNNEGVKELQKDLSKVVEPFTKTVTDVISKSNNEN